MARSQHTAALSEPRIAELLAPYLKNLPNFQSSALPNRLYAQLSTYLDLLLRWNARTNLTAIRDPEEIVQRHFGESLFAGIHLAGCLPPAATLLDFGSGAGFPGLPVQLLLPTLRVTLAESQGKKAAFLQEAARTLSVPTEIWPHRVEEMPPDRLFDAVTLRAVDRISTATASAAARVRSSGWLATLAGAPAAYAATRSNANLLHYIIPNSTSRSFILEQR